MKIKDGCALLSFSHASNGFRSASQIDGFEIAGPDHKFLLAKAFIKGRTLVVCHYQIKNPVVVHYCFNQFQLGSFKSAEGMPALPFRTEKQPHVTK